MSDHHLFPALSAACMYARSIGARTADAETDTQTPPETAALAGESAPNATHALGPDVAQAAKSPEAVRAA